MHKNDKTLPNEHTSKICFSFQVSHDVMQLPQTTFLVRILFKEEIQQDCVASS